MYRCGSLVQSATGVPHPRPPKANEDIGKPSRPQYRVARKA
jgi:hypothetical protein